MDKREVVEEQSFREVTESLNVRKSPTLPCFTDDFLNIFYGLAVAEKRIIMKKKCPKHENINRYLR